MSNERVGPSNGYLATPSQGSGPGVLVFHAWWGMTDFVRAFCDRLAGDGFVAFAPDLFQGRNATTIEGAEALLKQRVPAAEQEIATAALAFLKSHEAVQGTNMAVLGFSFGAAWAIDMASQAPNDINATVLFYGVGEADFAAARTTYQGHFATNDEWEPIDGVEKMESDMQAAGRETAFYVYPNQQHWFMETDRPEYNAEAAALAWQRTVAFLKQKAAGA